MGGGQCHVLSSFFPFLLHVLTRLDWTQLNSTHFGSTDWLTDWLPDWLTDCLTDCLTVLWWWGGDLRSAGEGGKNSTQLRVRVWGEGEGEIYKKLHNWNKCRRLDAMRWFRCSLLLFVVLVRRRCARSLSSLVPVVYFLLLTWWPVSMVSYALRCSLTLSWRCDPLVGHGIHEQCRPTVSLSDLCRFEYYLSEIWHTDNSWITQLFHANRASIHYVLRE